MLFARLIVLLMSSHAGRRRRALPDLPTEIIVNNKLRSVMFLTSVDSRAFAFNFFDAFEIVSTLSYVPTCFSATFRSKFRNFLT